MSSLWFTDNKLIFGDTGLTFCNNCPCGGPVSYRYVRCGGYLEYIRLADDGGPGVNISGICYSQYPNQPSPGAFDTIPQSGDTLNITERTYTYNDDYERWNACEECVAHLPEHTRSLSWSNENGVAKLLFTPTVEGLMRIWGNNRFWVFRNLNSIHEMPLGTHGTLQDSYPLWVFAGDNIRLELANPDDGNGAADSVFCPKVWGIYD